MPAPRAFRTHAPSLLLVLCAGTLQAPHARAQEDTTQRVSIRESGAQVNGISRAPSITAEGRVIVFQSLSRNLVVGDLNGVSDVFLRRRRLPETTVRVSVSTAGAEANGPSTEPMISAPGRHVAYTSRATNLIPNDFNFLADVFVFDRTLHTTTRVNVSTAGVETNDDSGWPSISADGRFVAFQSTADNLVAGDFVGCGGSHPCANGLDVFVRDLVLGTTTRVTLFPDGLAHGAPGLGSRPSISADGTHVAFESTFALVPTDTNGGVDIYVKNLVTGVLVQASGPASAVRGIGRHALAGDGTRVVFREANQILVRDLIAGTTTVVSQTGNGIPANAACVDPTISDDGNWAAFTTRATNLLPGLVSSFSRAFYKDLTTGEVLNASIDSFDNQANGDCFAPTLSSNGRYAAYSSEATNLILEDTNHSEDIFLRDRVAPIAFRYCTGDHPGAACPCGNYGSFGRGCENSFATGGTLLLADGSPSLTLDTLTLNVVDFGPETFAILVQSDSTVAGGLGTPFGDGLQCLGQNQIILGTNMATLGICNFGQDAGDPPLSVTGGIPAAGGTYYYQALYRHAQRFCTPSEFNTTNGLRIPWTP